MEAVPSHHSDAPLRPEVVPPELPDSPATRLARSFFGLLVGESRADDAERVAAAGWSVGRTVTAPMRKLLEPVVERRAPAAADAAVAFVDLVREATAEAIDFVDINGVLEKLDLNAVLARVDMNALMANLDLNAVLERVDLDLLMSKVDVGALLERVDVNELMSKVDVNDLMSRVDIDDLLNRVDINAMLERVDLNELMNKVDIDDLVARTEMGSLIVQSTSGVASEALDAVRGRAVTIDSGLNRLADKIMRRKEPPPLGPAALIGQGEQ